MISSADVRHLRCLPHSLKTLFQRLQINIQVKGAIGHNVHLGLKRIISARFDPKIMLTFENRIAIPLGGKVSRTSNEHSIDVDESLCWMDLEDQVCGIGSDDLRIYGTRNSQQVYSGASCGKGVGHRFVIWLGMKRRSVNQGSGMKVAADVQIRPEEEQGTGRGEEVSFRDANKEMIPTKRDGES